MSKYCEQCTHMNEPICAFCHTIEREGNEISFPTQFTLKLLKGDTVMSDNCELKQDMVNHPPHYERDGAMECIDEMLMLFGESEVMTFCKLNAWKYRYRAADKNGAEDIKKSDWYLNKYKELKEKKNSLFVSSSSSPSYTITPL